MNPYRTPVRLRGYGRVTAERAHGARDACRAFRILRPGMLRAEHARRAAAYQRAIGRIECLYHAERDAAALETWGRPWRFSDYRISGIGSDAFPEARKDRLRRLAHARTRCADRARLHAHAARYGRG